MDRRNDKLLNQKEVAKLLGISQATIITWIREKRLTIPCVEIGTRKRWWQGDVYEWLEQTKKNKQHE